MSGFGAMVDVAIGLILVYLILSLLGTVINEFLATALRLRASTLKTGLENIIDDPVLKADFDNHGLIAASNNTVGTGQVSYIAGGTFAAAILGSLDPTKPLPAFSDLKSAITHMPDSNIRDVLLAQLTAANGDIDRLRQNIAGYFDAAMDRLSGVYKRYLKLISLIVGLLVAAAINADSISIGTTLWKDASVRAQMVQDASAYVDTDKKTAQAASGVKDTADVVNAISSTEEKLRPFPIGWANNNIPQGTSWLVKLAGLIITALALSLGAPFWFDLLSQFMNVRGTGTKPDRAA